MAELVAKAIDDRRHLVVQAGTGTGKTLAYLVPAISSGSRVVVATATKALQDQLAGKDLPFLAEALAGGVRLGRAQGTQQLRVPATAPRADGAGRRARASSSSASCRRGPRPSSDRIAKWVATTPTGDVAELDFGPERMRPCGRSRVGSDECPGAERCPMGEPCFAELAAATSGRSPTSSSSTPTSTASTSRSGGTILPEHDVVVFDEAHGLEDIMSTTLSVQIGPGPVRHPRRR